jgi:hypothetical protein
MQDNNGQLQVLGVSMSNIVSGFGSFSLLASQIILEEKLGRDDGSGLAVFEPDAWYPLGSFLRALERIATEFGDYTLRNVGASVPRNSLFPDFIKDIHSALQSVDVAYHMNHATNGEALFSPATGQMKEGIGHYGYKRVEGKNQIVCEVSGPYPCAFNEGLIMAMAQRFEPTASLKHEPGACRKNGARACTYTITTRK